MFTLILFLFFKNKKTKINSRVNKLTLILLYLRKFIIDLFMQIDIVRRPPLTVLD
jgi:hypothetical protein